MKIDVEKALQILDLKLSQAGENLNITICGGASLVLLGLNDRKTADIDVLLPRISEKVKEITLNIKEEMDYSKHWFNTGASSFINILPRGWEERCTIVYKGKSLTAHSISKLDLAVMKLYGSLDRDSDYRDLLKIRMSEDDLNKLSQLAKLIPHLQNDPRWFTYVDKTVDELRS